jgi:hypothetical protein|tara:strand:- start:1777 stop:1992 length:216 start_codon:yes stop_codon:yes gene_type:complete
MISIALFCSGFLIVLFSAVGFGFGWMGREYYENTIVHNRLSDHPEMIDDNGNPIQTDLYSVRFVVDEEDDD